MAHKAILRTRLECQYGLLDVLLNQGVISAEEYARIQRPYSSATEQNDAIIEVMAAKQDVTLHEQFLMALSSTNQEHLATYIANEGGEFTRIY